MPGQQNTGRIQTTHIGSLPRPHDLLDIMKAKLNKQPYDENEFQAKLRKAVADTVKRQVECGIDIVTDSPHIAARLVHRDYEHWLVDTVAEARAGRPVLTDLFEAPIKIGWNLVALRATPLQTMTAEDLCLSLNGTEAGTALELARWELGAWESHLCGLPPNSFPMETGRGYFIRASRATTWSYRGEQVLTPAPQPLTVGWNLVSVPTGPTSGPTTGRPKPAPKQCTLATK